MLEATTTGGGPDRATHIFLISGRSAVTSLLPSNFVTTPGMRRLVTLVSLLVAALAWPSITAAADRTNIPLKNWGGFSLYRDAVYDDLERLVTAGLGDRAILNTKPLNRTEAARLVARAIEKIRSEQGTYNSRPDLEPVLDRLIKELRTELGSLGVQLPGATLPPAPFFSFTPVDRAQVRGGFASRDVPLDNRQGLTFQRGVNGGTTFETRAQIGDVLTFYLQPELHANEEFWQARLSSGYVKLTLWNVELQAGRDSLWWGPGYNGSLIMSANAPPLDHVRIGSAEPFHLPLVGDWIGPTRILAFFGVLEERREIPRPNLAGMRVTVSPFTWLELGGSYVNMFGGETPPRLRGVGDYLRVFIDPEAQDQNRGDERFRNNSLFSVDAELRFANVDRYYLPSRDLRIYGEFGWDDTCCSTAFIPLRDAASFLFGVHLIGLFGDDDLEARLEIATSSRFSFTHNQFVQGYWTRGHVISHLMGTDGLSTFSRIARRFGEDLMVGAGVRIAEIGNTTINANTPLEKRLGGSVDVTWRFADAWSLFAQFDLMYTRNRDFVSGDNGVDGIVLLELTRAFR